MKRILVAILIITLIAGTAGGCGENQSDIQEEFLKMIDKPASEKNIEEINDFLNKYLSKLEKDNASHMVAEYEEYILNNKGNDGINYKDFIEEYSPYINSELTQLYNYKAMEQEKPMEVNTELQISWDEIIKRAYNIEKFIEENKDENLIKEDAQWIYGNYINTIIMGTNSSPIFDVNSKEFSEEAKIAMKNFVKENPDSTTAWVLKEYFNYLESIDYALDYTDKVKSKSFFDTCTWLVSEARKRVYQ
ncbi:hypothetical protein [Anaerovorax odorimutans]|uniref:hypothetical protein n=1 Tax=Anaerovorax odorimutans TaxID=109327 RepID=UPI0004038B1D|nr:hypothetical protein [Anaerovorax odorimutans]